MSVARLNPFDLIRPEGIIDTVSGELVPLDRVTTPQLVRLLGLVQHHIDGNLAGLYSAKRMLGDEMIARMDRQAKWTVKEPGVEVKAQSPTAGTITWNGEKLYDTLMKLTREGMIDREAALRAAWPDTIYKTDQRAIDALRKIPGVEDRIAHARIVTPVGDRKASVRVDPRHL